MADILKEYNNYAGAIKNLQKNNSFDIYWSPDFFCNYSCSYCWPGAHSNKRTHLPPEILISGLNILQQKIKEIGYDNIRLIFAGGEPTLVPKFLEFIESYCKDQTIKKTLSINTNLTQGKNWWNRFLDITKNLNELRILASWHRESVGDVKLARQKFLDINDIFKIFNKRFFITIVVPPSQFDDVYSDALFFRANKIDTLIRIERKIINGKMDVHPDYSNDMIDAIIDWNNHDHVSFIHNENGIITNYGDVEQVIALGKLNYYEWKCYAGMTSVLIKPNGDIMRGHTCIDKKIGSILDASYSLWTEPKICITKKCGCSADMIIPKIK